MKTQELVSIIVKMTKLEKARFSSSVTEINKKSNFYKLFELIEKEPNIQGSKLRQSFESESVFFGAKKYLYNRLCEAMILESATSDVELGNMYNTQLAYVLYKKGFYDLAEILLKSLIKEEPTFIEAGIQTMASVLLTRVGFMRQDLDLLKYSDDKFQELVRYIGLVEKYRSFKIYTDPKYSDIEMIKAEIESYKKDEQYFKSARDVNGYYYFMALIYEVRLNDFSNAYVYHEKAFNLFLNEFKVKVNAIRLQEVETAFIILNHYIISSIITGHLHEAETAVNELIVFARECKYENLFAKKVYLITLNCYCMKTGDLMEFGLAETKKMIQYIDLSALNSIDLSVVLFFNSNLFLTGDYKSVIRNFSKADFAFKNTEKDEFISSYILYARLLLIFSHIKLHHFDIAENLVNKLKSEPVTDPDLDELKGIIIGFSDYCTCSSTRALSENMLAAGHILACCQAFQQSTLYKVHSFFDLEKWIKQELIPEGV
jgi:hypothetical protein